MAIPQLSQFPTKKRKNDSNLFFLSTLKSFLLPGFFFHNKLHRRRLQKEKTGMFVMINLLRMGAEHFVEQQPFKTPMNLLSLGLDADHIGFRNTIEIKNS